MVLKYLTFVYTILVFLSCASIDAAEPGFVEGHLKIIFHREVQLSDQTQTQENAPNYADFPLIVLSQDRKKEIARVAADAKGNYRIALSPGDYILDIPGRAPGRMRAKPQFFAVVSNQTVRVDMTIDTGVR